MAPFCWEPVSAEPVPTLNRQRREWGQTRGSVCPLQGRAGSDMAGGVHALPSAGSRKLPPRSGPWRNPILSLRFRSEVQTLLRRRLISSPQFASVARTHHQPGACKCRRVDEDILSPVVLTDKTETLVGLVHLNGTNTFAGRAYDLRSRGRASLCRGARTRIIRLNSGCSVVRVLIVVITAALRATVVVFVTAHSTPTSQIAATTDISFPLVG